MRCTEIKRETKETSITLRLNLDGAGVFQGSSGIGFFDHMLTALAVHSGFDIDLEMKGDLEVDGHHSVEDVGIVLGQAFAQVVDKKNIQRFGSFYVPMDESLAFVHWISAGGLIWFLTPLFLIPVWERMTAA